MEYSILLIFILISVIALIISLRLEKRIKELEDANRILSNIRGYENISQLELQVLERDKMASLVQLAGGVAHEINNPLAVILGQTQILLSQGEREKLSQDTVRSLKTIEKYTDRITQITEGLLNFTNQTEVEFVPLDVNESAGEVFSFLEEQLEINGVRLIKRLADRLPRIVANKNEMRELLFNLIVNAKESMPEGGRLSITTRPHEGNSIEIIIQDTGKGIARSDLNKIFDPFFSTKATGNGTGIGLSICYGIVERQGGSIKVKSEVGNGTTFTILLPTKTRGRQ